jgi:hypothetical protein
MFSMLSHVVISVIVNQIDTLHQNNISFAEICGGAVRADAATVQEPLLNFKFCEYQV